MRTLATATLALALLSAGCVTTGTYEKKEKEAKKLLDENKGLRQNVEDETAGRAVCQENLKNLQTQIDNLVADVNSLKEKIHSDESTLSQKEAELRASRQRVTELQALVDELSKSKKKLEVAKAELEKKSGEYEQLASALRGEIESGRVELMELKGRTTVKMKDKILFASGSATIGTDGREALKKVSDALRTMQGKAIRVEGHTDNVPTGHSGPFASNWELSAARALAVVRFFQENGVDPTRLSGAGFGEFQPIAANDTPEGRSQNRRIEIGLVPLEGATPAPAAPAPAAQPASKM
jgi:chemotaxis protein MotB